MLDFQLFRLKVVRPVQEHLFDNELSNLEAVLAVIAEKPSGELRRGHFWHIGNFELLANGGIYFRLGRTTKATVSLYDEKAKDFEEREFENAPYTHVLVDPAIGLCAIARKYQLAPSPEGIARQLQRLLFRSGIARAAGLGFTVAPLSDPTDFLAQLERAYAVVSFAMTFSRPNPFDAEALIQRPMEELLQATDGTDARATLHGEQLDVDVLKDLTVSVAATGNDAVAKLRYEPNAPVVRRSLRERAIFIALEGLETIAEMVGALDQMRSAFRNIRERSDDENGNG